MAKWTAAGRAVRYVLACRGEAGIAGMPPEQAGPIREAEQRRSAEIVGVDSVDFWDFPDSDIRDTPQLRAAIAAVLHDTRPDVVVTIHGGSEWDADQPNQRDHIEFAAAVTAAFDGLAEPDAPRWLFQYGPQPTHVETVDDFVAVAVDALAAHQVYLSVLDPQTPVRRQAEQIIAMTVPVLAECRGQRVVRFRCLRGDRG